MNISTTTQPRALADPDPAGAASFPQPLVKSLLILAVVWAILWSPVMSVAVFSGSRRYDVTLDREINIS